MPTDTTSFDRSPTSPLQRVIWIATGVMLTIVASIATAQAWSASAAPGDDDATYVPIPNCRVFDFRDGQTPDEGRKTPLGPGETHTQQITGTVGDCSIPNSAVGVAMNVTVANGTAQSNLRVFPGDVMTVPTVSNLNWLPGDSPTPNKVDVKLSPAGTIKLYNFQGTVDVLSDIVGYYTSETLQELNQNVELLLNSRSFTVDANEDPFLHNGLSGTPASYLDVTITAPVHGQVTVVSSAEIGAAGSTALCSIHDEPGTIASGYEQSFRSLPGATLGNVSGVRTFDMTAGQTATFHLVCKSNSGSGQIQNRSMSATFNPVINPS